MTTSSNTYLATVTDNQDPEQRGRVLVTCEAVLGDSESTLPDWIEPALPWGQFLVPDVGELIEIEVAESSDTDEHPGQISIDGLDAKWRGIRLYADEIEVPTVIHAEFLTNYGKRRGFATPAGHVIFFDDTEDQQQVTIKTAAGANVVMDDAADTITVTVKGGAKITIDGNTNKVSVEAGEINLNGDAHSVAFGDVWLTEFNNHIHPTGVGPSGPPQVPLVDANVNSQTVKTG